jgi:hypothetical protein
MEICCGTAWLFINLFSKAVNVSEPGSRPHEKEDNDKTGGSAFLI